MSRTQKTTSRTASKSAAKDAEAAGTRGMARKAIDTSQNVANSLIETNRAIWLAGLGALSSLSRTASGSPALQNFEALVKAGAALEERSKTFVDTSFLVARKSVDSVVTKVDDKLEEFESVFDKRIADTLNRLSIPSRTEVAILMHRIEMLEAEVKAIKKER